MQNQRAPSLTPVDNDATRVTARIEVSALRLGFLLGHTYLIESLIARGQVGQRTEFQVIIPLGSSHLPGERIRQPRTLASSAIGAQAFVEEVLRCCQMPEEQRPPTR
jgi:hypothetical protein